MRGLSQGEATRILVIAHGVVRALESFLNLSPENIVPVGPGSLTLLQGTHANGLGEFRLELFNFSPGGPVLDAPG